MAIENPHHKRSGFGARPELLICLFLVLSTLSAFWQVRNHSFTNFDDNDYVTENPYVRAGLTREGVVWAFTKSHSGNWHPLTWLSHMLDVHLYGLDPGQHHLTNLLFHILNTLLLFTLFSRMTGDAWRSGLVAALFALHPLHVESVAWVAERKDVLCAFFWMLSLFSYACYVEQGGALRYVGAVFFFGLGLLSKPMVVTLPFVLILMDYWPLGRFKRGACGEQRKGLQKMNPVLVLFLEKLPFFILSGAACILTYLVLHSYGGILKMLPIHARIANAVFFYAAYIGKTVWPFGLAVFYPHPGVLPLWHIAGAGLLLLSVSAGVLRVRRNHPYLVFGWLWYLGTFIPVIGIVQQGLQAMADRYTYIPLIGLFIMIAWGAPSLLNRCGVGKSKIISMAAVGLAILIATTWMQAGVWRDSITLFEHALDVAPDNPLALNNLGTELYDRGKPDEAAALFSTALRLSPDDPQIHNNLGLALAARDGLNTDFYSFLNRFMPDADRLPPFPDLLEALAAKDRTTQTVRSFSNALRLDPNYADAHNNLGAALACKGNVKAAVFHFREAVRLKPDFAAAHNNLSRTLATRKRATAAIEQTLEAIRQNPESADLYARLGHIYFMIGEYDKAIEQFAHAHPLESPPKRFLSRLATVHAVKGDYGKTVFILKNMLQTAPDCAALCSDISLIYARQRLIEESIHWLAKAFAHGFRDCSRLINDGNFKPIKDAPGVKELLTANGCR